MSNASDSLDIYNYFKNLNDQSDYSSKESKKWGADTEAELTLAEKAKLSTALTLGKEAGIYFAEGIIREILEPASDDLDEILDVSMYIEAYKNHLIIPAVIHETNGRKEYLDESHTAFVYADITYEIQKMPYFADKPPSWRDYIVLKSLPPKIPSKNFLPSTEKEKAMWKAKYDEGWRNGQIAAIQNLKFQFTRALYDMDGMRLYGMMRDANIVSKPIINDSKTPISGDDIVLEMNGGMISITVMPTLNHDAKSWKIIPQLPPINDLIEDKYFRIIEGMYE